MNIQDLTREQATHMLNGTELPILLGYDKGMSHTINPENSVAFSDDPRFVLPDCAPYVRRLEMTRENEEVLVGIFSIPENWDKPYPLCAQYSLYMVDKKNPNRNCGGGIIGCQAPYPPIRDRVYGMDRVDYQRVQAWINECLLKSGFSCQFPIDSGESHHRYWEDKDDSPINGPTGTERRGRDGTLRVLEYTRQNEDVYIEVVSMPERFTEYSGDGPNYSIDVFRLDKTIITGFPVKSSVIWPPLRNRKFGMDYQDYIYTQQIINNAIIYRGWGTPFDVDYDKNRPCYFAKDKELKEVIVMKRSVAEANMTYINPAK